MGATAGTTGYSKTFAGSNGCNAMGGNVNGWNWDWLATDPTGARPDYRGAVSGTFRVLRGGSRGSDAALCTVARRNSDYPYTLDSYVGFRVVRR